jgi:hypothetical protein
MGPTFFGGWRPRAGVAAPKRRGWVARWGPPGRAGTGLQHGGQRHNPGDPRSPPPGPGWRAPTLLQKAWNRSIPVCQLARERGGAGRRKGRGRGGVASGPVAPLALSTEQPRPHAPDRPRPHPFWIPAGGRGPPVHPRAPRECGVVAECQQQEQRHAFGESAGRGGRRGGGRWWYECMEWAMPLGRPGFYLAIDPRVQRDHHSVSELHPHAGTSVTPCMCVCLCAQGPAAASSVRALAWQGAAPRPLPRGPPPRDCKTFDSWLSCGTCGEGVGGGGGVAGQRLWCSQPQAAHPSARTHTHIHTHTHTYTTHTHTLAHTHAHTHVRARAARPCPCSPRTSPRRTPPPCRQCRTRAAATARRGPSS